MNKFDSKPDTIILHHSASTFGDAETIRGWHLDRGFDDIGYHFVIGKDGLIEKGRDPEYKGAHCKAQGMNHRSLGICLIGDSTKEECGQNQIYNLIILVRSLKHFYGDMDIYQHSDFEPNKPYCADLDGELIEDLRKV